MISRTLNNLSKAIIAYLSSTPAAPVRAPQPAVLPQAAKPRKLIKQKKKHKQPLPKDTKPDHHPVVATSSSAKVLPWLAIRAEEKAAKIKKALEQDQVKANKARAKKQKQREKALANRPPHPPRPPLSPVITEAVIPDESKPITAHLPVIEEKASASKPDFEINPEDISVDKKHPLELGTSRQCKLFQGFWQGQSVALKFLNTPPASHKFQRHLQLFLSELDKAKEMATLHLPATVQFFGAVRVPASQHYCLVMENLQKGTLFDWLQMYENRNENPPRLALFKILRSLAAGIAELHDALKIHRDLKLENVMLYGDDQIKLIDFEFLIQAPAGQTGVTDDVAVGTPRYEAPEIPNQYQYSFASDMFAFGTMLFIVGTLCLPFQSKSSQEAQALTNAGRIREFHPEDSLRHWGCPEELIPLIHQCWETEPSHRPTARALMQTFEALVRLEETRQANSFYPSP